MDVQKYVIVSREEGLYDRVSRRIATQDPNSEVVKAYSVQEGVAILRQVGTGIIVTDLSNVDTDLSNLEIAFSIAPGDAEKSGEPPGAEDGGETKKEPHEIEKADLRTVKQYVRLHLNEELTLVKLSEMVCLSPNYLSSLFKKREGISLKTFIEKNRIERAAYLLTTEDSTMSEISARVGYHHCSYFCQVFREYYGVTPLQFRRRNRPDKKNKKQTGKKKGGKGAAAQEVEVAKRIIAIREAETVDQDNVVRETEVVNQDAAVREAEAAKQIVAIREAEALDQDTAARETEVANQDAAVREAEALDQDTALRETEVVNLDAAVREAETADQNTAVLEAEAVNQDTAVRETEAVNRNNAVREAEAMNRDDAVREVEAMNRDDAVREQETVNESDAGCKAEQEGGRR